MFSYAILFFLIAGVAALVGFNDLAPDLTATGRIVFYAFLIGGCVLIICGLPRR